MKLLILLLFVSLSHGLKNYTGSDLRNCLNCLCHARTGCYSRYNCASYSINLEYWKKAKSPIVDVDDEPESEEAFRKCMKNEMCILTTIDQYADEIGHMDCNCDGSFDCKDRFAIHLFGEKCISPKFTKRFADRFNQCAQELDVDVMLPEEGEDCNPEDFS